MCNQAAFDCVVCTGVARMVMPVTAMLLDQNNLTKPCVYWSDVSVTRREANRMSVLHKLEQGHEAQAELAIRYWRQNSYFDRYSLIKIASCSSYNAAWTLEHVLISTWQSKLNIPFAQAFLKRAALGFRLANQRRGVSFSRFGIRLWIKLRKRFFHSPIRKLFARMLSPPGPPLLLPPSFPRPGTHH